MKHHKQTTQHKDHQLSASQPELTVPRKTVLKVQKESNVVPNKLDITRCLLTETCVCVVLNPSLSKLTTHTHTTPVVPYLLAHTNTHVQQAAVVIRHFY